MKTILLVDDDPCMLELIGSILENEGYRVFRSRGAAEAAARIGGEQGIDLALIDVRMPRISGPELAGLLRQINPDLKLAYVSGVDNPPNGQTPILFKPFTVDALLKLVRELV